MALNILVSSVAGLLYATAYFQFVNLLRFLRNWIPISKVDIGKTVILLILVITFPSISSGKFEGSTLVFSLIFVCLMFFIIAAPALAFSPTRSIIEFFAKHGDYAGLWLSPVAFGLGVTVPNAGLRGILIISVLIELSWFVRRMRQDRHRVTQPLDEAAITVLTRQAEGDLKKFANKNKITELVFNESVAWRGCTKNSAPCPFNFYVNNLGMNTAPCCREHLIELCLFANNCLEDLAVIHWLEGGTLLGAVREANLLAWEDDVDISVLLNDEITWEHFVSLLRHRAVDAGYAFEAFPEHEVVSFCFDRRGILPFGYERNRFRGDLRVDISTYRQGVSEGNPVLERFTSKAGMPLMKNGKYGVPRDLILPTTNILLFDKTMPCPQNFDAYLRLLYGEYSKIEYTYIKPEAAEKRGENIELED